MKKIFKNKRIVITSIILAIIILFYIIYTFITFKIAIDFATRNSEYKDARAYMVSALMVNKRYIYPLTETFGYDRAIIKPFYFIRDKLFDIGYSKFPKDEGEKEFWWVSIKFKEFEDCASPALIKWGWTTHPKYLDSKQNDFINRVDDLYLHLDKLAHARITNKTDKLLAIQKNVDFAIVARRYEDSNTILKWQIEENNLAKQGIKNQERVLPPEDIKRFEHVYDTYNWLLNYSKQHEKESYNYFQSTPDHWLFGDIMAYKVVEDLLNSKLYTNTLDCNNDRFIKIFADEQRKIRNFYSANEHNPKINHSLMGDAYIVAKNANIILAYKCQKNPVMQDYIKYIFTLDDYKKDKNLETIKNKIIQGDIREKEYDDLKQLESIGIR